MSLPPRARKVVLTAHVVTSVGWLGAVAAYLALDVTAVTSQDVRRAGAAFLAMELTAAYVIVPLAIASVVIGVINALVTPWGLIRHYWVLVKLIATLLATTVLLIETQTIGAVARLAGSGADPRELPGSLPHSIGGLLVLLFVVVLSIFKPPGLTPYGWRVRHARP